GGISSLKNRQRQKEAYKKTGLDLSKEQTKHLKEGIKKFEKNLTDFALKYKSKINKNPVFRHQFQEMCNKIGIDPLISNRSLIGKLTGLGNFYVELAVKIINICLKTRNENGGIILISSLLKKIGNNINETDIKKAIEKISKFDKSFRIEKFAGGEFLISVPFEINNDFGQILNSLKSKNGVNFQFLNKDLNWDKNRLFIAIVLNRLNF
ncbi:ESCRT-II subunit protein snf8, partial [Bonamia ostreae]